MIKAIALRLGGIAVTATALYYGFSYVQAEAIRGQEDSMKIFKGENDSKVKDFHAELDAKFIAAKKTAKD
eukprot:CFRG3412T1